MSDMQQTKEKIWSRDFLFLCFANFFIFAGFQMTLPTLPLFVNELGGDDNLIGYVVGVFTISALIIRPWAGKVLETLGRRTIYLLGLFIFIISVGFYAFTTSILLLFLMRIVQGVGWGMSTTAVGTVATDLIPAKRRGEGMGYFGLSGNLAMAFGPALGLLLIAIIGFSQSFLIAALFGLLSLIMALFIQYKQVEKNETVLKTKKLDLYEKTAVTPSVLLFFITMVFGGITSFLPLYTQQEGISGIGWYFFTFAIAMMSVRSFAGRLYDKKGHKVVFVPGTILIIGAMLHLVFLSSSWMLVVAAFLFGTGFGSVLPALQAWAVQEAPMNRRGMANATFFSFFDLGVGLGAIFFGYIATHFGYSEIYMVSAVSVAVSIALYLFLTRKDMGKVKEQSAHL